MKRKAKKKSASPKTQSLKKRWQTVEELATDMSLKLNGLAALTASTGDSWAISYDELSGISRILRDLAIDAERIAKLREAKQ